MYSATKSELLIIWRDVLKILLKHIFGYLQKPFRDIFNSIVDFMIGIQNIDMNKYVSHLYFLCTIVKVLFFKIFQYKTNSSNFVFVFKYFFYKIEYRIWI